MDELLTALQGLGLPLAYDHFAEGEAPDPPFLCYLAYRSNNLFADDQVFFRIDALGVELYTEVKDPLTEAMVESALAPFCWEKHETYIDTERLYQITYEIEV